MSEHAHFWKFCSIYRTRFAIQWIALHLFAKTFDIDFLLNSDFWIFYKFLMDCQCKSPWKTLRWFLQEEVSPILWQNCNVENAIRKHSDWIFNKNFNDYLLENSKSFPTNKNHLCDISDRITIESSVKKFWQCCDR